MTDKRRLCPPCPRVTCPGGCLPGQCLNASCKYRLYDPAVITRPDVEIQAEERTHCIEKAKEDHYRNEKLKFFKDERRRMGMESFFNVSNDEDCESHKPTDNQQNKKCAKFTLPPLKTPDGVLKTMRDPARPSCMLEPPTYIPPSDDYNDLSRFLRISTMPGYSNNELVSEYHDNHNMAVWNKRKDIDPQMFKMKRDWLSVWGEFNVVEQRWRKAWIEKYGV